MAKELRPYRDELGEFKNDEESTVREESAPKSSVRKTALKILLASSEYHARFVRVTNDFENKLGAILTLLPIRLPTPHYYFPLTPRWCRRSGLIHQFEALVQVISLSNRDEPKKDCSLSPSGLDSHLPSKEGELSAHLSPYTGFLFLLELVGELKTFPTSPSPGILSLVVCLVTELLFSIACDDDSATGFIDVSEVELVDRFHRTRSTFWSIGGWGR